MRTNWIAQFQRDCALGMDYAIGCITSKGGLKRMFIIELDSVKTITAASGAVTAITQIAAKKWRKYELARSTAEASAEQQINQENGSTHVVETVSIVLNTVSAAVSNELKAVAGNRLAMIIVDRNDNGWLYGKDYGMTAKTIKASTGKAGGDRNGYDIAFEGDEDELPWYVPSSLFAALLVPGT